MHNHDEDFEYDYTNEHIVLNKLVDSVGSGMVEYNILNFYSYNLKVTLFLKVQGVGIANATFVISHPESDDEIVESVASFGKNVIEALNNVAENFYITTLKPILDSFNSKSKESIKISLGGREHLFYKYESEVLYTGTREGEVKNLYDVIKDDIKKYIGSKKLYLVKIYACFSVDTHICEVRINGIIIPKLTERIREYAQSWIGEGKYYAEKQCVAFLQDDATFEVCPFTKEEILKYTKKLIKVFEMVKDEKMYYKIYDFAMEVTQNRRLAQELFFLIPEIYCEVGFVDLKFIEDMILIKKSGAREQITCYQLRNYSYIKEGIYEYLEEERPTDDKMFRVIGLSARYSGLEKAVQSGEKIEDLVLGAIVLPVEEDYIIY